MEFCSDSRCLENMFINVSRCRHQGGRFYMSSQEYYEKCCAFVHQPVEIKCSDGNVHHGIIDSVDQEKVYLRPFDTLEPESESRNPGVFFFGPALLGGFAGGLLGVGLGSIIAVRPYPYGPYGPMPPYGPGPYYGPYGGSYSGFYGPGPYY